MALDELGNESDNKVLDNDINIIYDNSMKSYVENKSNMVIDFKDSVFGSGFVIDNGIHC